MKIVSLTLFLSIQAFYCVGQQYYNTEKFFTYVSEKIVPNLSAKPAYRSAWISFIEIRSESDEFLLPNQEYQLRITPLSPGQRRSRKDYLNLLYQKTEIQQIEEQQVFLSLIYKEWVDLYLHHELLQLYKAKDSILHDQLVLLKNNLNSKNFGYKKILSKEKEKQLLNIKINDHKTAFQSIIDYYAISDQLVSFDDLITIDVLKDKITVLLKERGNIPLKEDQIDANLISKEIAIEKSNRNNIFDFFQLNYQGPHQLDIEEKITVGIGLKLSLGDNSKLKLKELQLEQEEELYKKQMDSIHTVYHRNKLKDQIFREITYYNLYQNLDHTTSKTSKDLESYLLAGDLDKSLEILEIKEDVNQTKIDMLIKKTQILQDYIDLLFSFYLLEPGETNYFLNTPTSLN